LERLEVIRSTLFALAVLSLMGVSAAQQPAAPDKPDGPWPPADASWPDKDGVTRPRLLHEATPQYTSDAMRARIEGKIALECVVETDGTVARVHVVRSLDKLFGLDETAVNAAKQWRFEPGTKDHVAIPVMIKIDMTFTLATR
jgi:TonB family protein